MFSYYNGVKLEINNRGRSGNSSNTWKLNNTFLDNQWVTEEIKGKVDIFEINKNTIYQIYGKFMKLNACFRQEESLITHYLSFHLEKLKKINDTNKQKK